MTDLETYLEAAERIAREAGALLMKGFRGEKKIDRKSSAVDWVTQSDTDAEALIVGQLQELFPTHGIVGEEGANRVGEDGYVWHVDPLDGTNNFAHNFPVFAVSMALYQRETPLVGVVYDPTRDECFSAAKGGGAFLISPFGKEKLHVTQTDQLVNSLLATGFPYDRHSSANNNSRELAAFLKVAQGIRRPGAAALDLVYVAAGRLDGYWEHPSIRTWDMAAGRLCVEEAGGKITMMDGSPVRMEDRMSLLASNGKIHEQMLTVLASV